MSFTDQEHDETLRHFRNLIQINTTNPPGNEIAACQYLAEVFAQEKIPFQILESAPGRGNFIARLKGDGSEKPLLLTSHLDVVSCEKDKWQEDPFGAAIKDGFVWGRGAVDMKNMTAMELAVFLKAAREKLPLKRDLIFAAIADEEAGCQFGSKWLVENHPDLIRSEYALNEVGGFSLTIDDTIFYPIGVAEKGLCWFKIIARGDPGHGAMPHGNQALPHLCFAAHKLANETLPFHASAVVKEFVGELAKRQGLLKKLILSGTANKTFSNFILKNLFPDKTRARQFQNMFHNLATPTMLNAGVQPNVIPGSAELILDGRILPEQTVAGFLEEVQNLIGSGFEIQVMRAEEANTTEYSNSFYEGLKAVLIKHDPGAVPVPFLIPGYTDAKYYSKLGIKCYGFSPAKLPADLNFGALYHGHNERLPVSALRFGTNVMWDVIKRFCC